MIMEQIYEELGRLLSEGETRRIEPWLLSVREQAGREEDYASCVLIGKELFGYYRGTGEYRKAFAAAEDVLLLLEELGLEESEAFAAMLTDCAGACEEAGRLREAYRYYAQALAVYEQACAGGDCRPARICGNMAALLKRMGEVERVRPFLAEALAAAKKKKDGEAGQAVLLTALALSHMEDGKDREAAEEFKQAAALFEAAAELKDMQAEYLVTLSGLGETGCRLGNYEYSLQAYEKALGKVKELYGAGESVAVFCENCAAVCEILGRTEETVDYRLQAAAARSGH